MIKKTHDHLFELRENIKKVDEKLVSLIATRLFYVKQIGSYKKNNKLPIEDSDQEDLVKKSYIYFAKKNKIDINFVTSLSKLILAFSRQIQK